MVKTRPSRSDSLVPIAGAEIQFVIPAVGAKIAQAVVKAVEVDVESTNFLSIPVNPPVRMFAFMRNAATAFMREAADAVFARFLPLAVNFLKGCLPLAITSKVVTPLELQKKINENSTKRPPVGGCRPGQR